MDKEEKTFDLKSLRREYQGTRLLEEEMDEDPIEFFKIWLQEAIKTEKEPNAMTLATVGVDHYPDARIMLLKEVNSEGFVFFTNYESKKGKDLENQPYATLVFFWSELFRQVRIFGKVETTSEKEAIEYFQSRPYESQVAALISKQSQIMKNRDEAEQTFQRALIEFQGKTVPKPEKWGGYILKPLKIEFWQGRPARFHDRVIYERTSLKEGEWKRYRLYP
ncbi:MAG: pyridoxamine 5'-phosphate oxidase [Leptospiraceae bacterium]|nr:pyridoxamine 5'-phosphate oxidase [Leptospiraceae bacterium]MDW7975241.1 pyridoxamine 5'-phosphate oxidase [Leptospiraceae bacterium]